MAIEHLKASDSSERVVEILQRDGCCVVGLGGIDDAMAKLDG